MSFRGSSGCSRNTFGSTLPLAGWLLPIHETLWRTYWIVARWIRYNQNSALAHTVIVAITFRHLSIEFRSMRRRAIRDERQETTDETFRNKIKNSFRRDSKEAARDDFVSRRLEFFRSRRAAFLKAYAIVVERKVSPSGKLYNIVSRETRRERRAWRRKGGRRWREKKRGEKKRNEEIEATSRNEASEQHQFFPK